MSPLTLGVSCTQVGDGIADGAGLLSAATGLFEGEEDEEDLYQMSTFIFENGILVADKTPPKVEELKRMENKLVYEISNDSNTDVYKKNDDDVIDDIESVTTNNTNEMFEN
eukprot:Pgem_evm2s14707